MEINFKYLLALNVATENINNVNSITKTFQIEHTTSLLNKAVINIYHNFYLVNIRNYLQKYINYDCDIIKMSYK